MAHAAPEASWAKGVLAETAHPCPYFSWNLLYALSYPAIAGPLLRGRFASTLARVSVVAEPTKHRCASPSCSDQGAQHLMCVRARVRVFEE